MTTTIQETATTASATREYVANLADTDGVQSLVIASRPVGDTDYDVVYQAPTGGHCKHLTIGLNAYDDGVYGAFAVDGHPQTSDQVAYFAATLDQMRSNARLGGGKVWSSPERFVALSGPTEDKRHLLVSKNSYAQLTVLAIKQGWSNYPRAAWTTPIVGVADEWVEYLEKDDGFEIARVELKTSLHHRPFTIFLNDWPGSNLHALPTLADANPSYYANHDPFDLNQDGQVDAADLGILIAGFGGDGVGDLNGDGVIDTADLALLLAAMNKEGE